MQQAITTEFKDLANNVKKVRHSILNDKDKNRVLNLTIEKANQLFAEIETENELAK